MLQATLIVSSSLSKHDATLLKAGEGDLAVSGSQDDRSPKLKSARRSISRGSLRGSLVRINKHARGHAPRDNKHVSRVIK